MWGQERDEWWHTDGINGLKIPFRNKWIRVLELVPKANFWHLRFLFVGP